MPAFDFDTPVRRRSTGSMKWDEAPADDVIPLWVADMDFRVAPAIQRALEQRVAHGVFGYTMVTDDYYEAVVRWFHRRHGWDISRSHLLYTSGVVPALSCTLKALTLPGEKVLVLTPVYNCFFSSIRNNGCMVSESRLRWHDQTYTVDWDDFERQCSDEKTTVFLLCNPHNPGGRVWTRDELQHMADICRRHRVAVVADEIHCELTLPGHRYVPFATVCPEAVILNSPSKSFNTAGLQIANIVCTDDALRRRIDRAININEVCDVNPFGPVALIAAYNEGEAWLDALNAYIAANYEWLCSALHAADPRLTVARLEGTYLAWVDIRPTGLTSDVLTRRLLNEARVMVSSGTLYGAEAGEGFIRINLATSRSRLDEALRRITQFLKTI